MKRILVLAILAFSSWGYAAEEVKSPKAYGHVWAGYSEDNFTADEVVLGLTQAYDETYSADVALVYGPTGAEGQNEVSLYVANVSAKGTLMESDLLVAGLQYQSYVGLLETTLGTAWLSPVFAVATGLLPEHDAGFTYGLSAVGLNVVASARNNVPADKHQTFGLLVSHDPAAWLKVVLAAEHNSVNKDRIYNAAVVANAAGLKAGLEYAVQAPHQENGQPDVKDTASYGLTADYSLATKYSVYAQYLTGDDQFKEASGYENTIVAGPEVALNKSLKVAALYHAVSAKTLDDAGEEKTETKDGVTLKLAAVL